MKEIKSRLWNKKNDTVKDIFVQTAPSIYDNVKLKITTETGRVWSANKTDIFECLISIHKEIEKESLNPLCYGARLNVWPSGTCRNLGNNILAYKMIMGKQTRRENLKNIFEPANKDYITTVEEQKNF